MILIHGTNDEERKRYRNERCAAAQHRQKPTTASAVYMQHYCLVLSGWVGLFFFFLHVANAN